MLLVKGWLMLLAARLLSIIHLARMVCPVAVTGPELILKLGHPDAAKTCRTQNTTIKNAVLFNLWGPLVYLEPLSIMTPTLQEHTRHAQLFPKCCREASLTWTDAVGLDHVLVPCLDHMCLEGLGYNRACHLLPTIVFFVAALSLLRVPIPLEVLGLIVGLLLVQQHRDIVTRAFVALMCCLQPYGSILLVWQLVRPTWSSPAGALLRNPLQKGVAGITNAVGKPVLIDSSPLLHSHFQFVLAFTEASQFLEMALLEATLHSLQHR